MLKRKSSVDWGVIHPDQFVLLMIQQSMQGFYGDPDNGGNRDGVSWSMVNYHPLPEGTAWPNVDEISPRVAAWDSIAEQYDAIVVGAGASGGIAACVLAEAGHRVLLVEWGRWLATNDLRPDHLRNQRVSIGMQFGYDPPAGPSIYGNPRIFSTTRGDVVVWPTDPRWHNNAMTVGVGTRVYGAQAWRFCPEDFLMATTYGVPEGSSQTDWPISYEDLEPDYDRAEWELGVAGDSVGNRYAGPRKRGYPMPPLRPNKVREVLRRGATALGLQTSPVSLLINSEPYNGRGACINCGTCLGFGCPGDFKTGTHNTVITRAIATGRCDVLINVQAEQIFTDAKGAVNGVALVTDLKGSIQRLEVMANQIVLGAGAIETARLLLNSPSTQEPHGIGNNCDQVRRHLQGHTYAGVAALFEEVVQDCVGPGPSIATNDYRHHNEGLIGGAMLASDFVPTPLLTWNVLTALQAIPLYGAACKRAMRDCYSRLAVVAGPVQEIPNPQSRVTLDPEVRDRFGIRVARLSGSLHPEDLKTARFISERAEEWVKASGAKTVIPMIMTVTEGPSGGQHQAGTCRMGNGLGTRELAYCRWLTPRDERWCEPCPDDYGPCLPRQPAYR